MHTQTHENTMQTVFPMTFFHIMCTKGVRFVKLSIFTSNISDLHVFYHFQLNRCIEKWVRLMPPRTHAHRHLHTSLRRYDTNTNDAIDDYILTDQLNLH